MFLDNEQDILNHTYTQCMNNPLLFNGNSFEKKIFRKFQDRTSLTQNNGHDALPPDYYSDIHSFMFDVMRINDTEVKKSYNPVKIRERNMEHELQKSGILDMVNPDCKIICTSDSDDEHEHNYKAYKRNTNRVIREHIKKLPIWQSEHNSIAHKGLLIFDETECYFEGYIRYYHNDEFIRIYDAQNIVLHEPWNDECFIQIAYESDLDFIIWVCAYKQLSDIPRKHNIVYPSIVVLDTRYPRTRKYIKYNTEILVS